MLTQVEPNRDVFLADSDVLTVGGSDREDEDLAVPLKRFAVD